jgi:hypothetical protein
MKEKRKAFYKVCFSYWYHERFKPFVRKSVDLICFVIVLLALICMALLGLYAIASAVGHL